MGLFSKLFKSKEEKEKAKKMKIGTKNEKTYSFSQIKNLLERKNKVDDSFYNELEEALILSDMGVDYTYGYIEALKKNVKKAKVTSIDELKEVMLSTFKEMYVEASKELNFNKNGLTVYLFVGVNGSGKTTSIAKVANMLKEAGKKVSVAAGDTYRAGAAEQLIEWGKRIGVNVISKPENSDPSSVIFDAIKEAKKDGTEYLLCDTAGRLQTKINLMKELEKIYRVIGREVQGAPHESFLVIDATTGQNGLSQAKVFNEAAKITGIILTKLDGSSKGGVALSINKELKIPIKLYGSGETFNDIDTFDVDAYLYNIFNGVLFEEE